METLKKNQIVVQELNNIGKKKISLHELNSILDLMEELAYIAHESFQWYKHFVKL